MDLQGGLPLILIYCFFSVNFIPVAQGHVAVGVTGATFSTRSVAEAVPETVLAPLHAALPMFGWLIVKMPATVDATAKPTVPVAELDELHEPVALPAGCNTTIVTSSLTVAPPVTYSNLPVQVPDTVNVAGAVGDVDPQPIAKAMRTVAISLRRIALIA
jgi:hypothetical protein